MKNRPKSLALALIAVGLITGQLGAAVILSPISVIRNDFGEWNSNYQVVSTINQEGLSPGSSFISGSTVYSDYVASSPTHLGNSTGGTDNWYGVTNSPSVGFMDFDLGDLYKIEALAFFSNPYRAFYEITVLTSILSDFSSATTVGVFTPYYSGNGTESAPLQDIDLTDNNARYVRFSMNGYYTPDDAITPSIGEVAFAVSPPTPSSIPEPTSVILFGVSTLCILTRRRRA